jgi:hypothetical protein
VAIVSGGRPSLRGVPRELRLRLAAARLEPQVTWIMGSPRSGTTWLAALLSSLTDAVLVDEPLIGTHLSVHVGAVTSLPSPDDPLLYDASRRRDDYVFSDRSARAWRPALRSLLLRRFAASAGRGRAVLVKEPNGSLAAPLLLATLPRSRLLFLVRDGRDVVDSLLDGVTGGWITRTHGAAVDESGRRDFIERRAHEWVRTVSAVRDAYDAHDPARRIRVTYEDLRAEPEREVARLLQWLGRADALPRVAEAVSLLSFERMPADKTGQGQFARAAQPGLWREHFSSEEVAVLEGTMGALLAEMGYS